MIKIIHSEKLYLQRIVKNISATNSPFNWFDYKNSFTNHLRDRPFNFKLNEKLKGRSLTVGKQTHDLTVIASDSKTTQSGGDNRKKFPLGAALQVPQNFSFAPL